MRVVELSVFRYGSGSISNMTSHFSGGLFRIRLAAWLAFFSVLVFRAMAAVPDDVRVPFPTVRLAGKVQGEAAIQSLSKQLPDIAAFYHKTPEQLQQQLRRDKSLWVDPRGRLFFVCNAPAPASLLSSSNETSAAAQLVPLDQTFLLHSRPGSTKTIFLDFDGHTISGTQWNESNNGGADIIAPPWDIDGNPNSFSSSERTIIQQIWLRVSEDYAPFDVDVTTEFPGDAALIRSNNGDQVYGTRALVSAISQYFGNYGGIAYVGVFDNTGTYYQPALIFPERLGNSEKNIAEAISHEVGHNLGLSHDGLLNDAADYYSGQGNWAPIMGVGYYEPITQWSKGEYANANNLEDDLQVIQQNGLSYRADDHGNNIANATLLAGAVIHTNGLIERNTDVDFFSFPTGSGMAQFTVTPFERGANLHLSVSLYDSGGTLITNREVADTSSSAQPVAIRLPLSSGIYYLAVEGLGSGDPVTTGYSDYASLGQYTISITLPGISSWIPIAGGDYSWTDENNWSDGVPNVSDANARLTNNLAGDQVIALNSAVTIGRLLIGDADASNTFTIEDGPGGALTFNTTSIDASLEKFMGADDVMAATVNLSRRLEINNSSTGNLTFSGAINGANGLVKSGSGLLTLAGTNQYFGDTIISNGTLALTASGSIANSATVNVEADGLLDVSQTGEWLVNTNQTIAGSGAVVGDTLLNGGGKIAPGNIARAGTLTFTNNLALNDQAGLIFDLAPTQSIGGATNDLLIVAGNFSLTGSNTFIVNALGGELASPGTYTVIQYGSLSGSAANLTYANPLTRYQVSADDSIPGELRLHVSGNPLPIVWQGDGFGNVWSVAGASNWLNGETLDQYYQLDSVTFDDSGSSLPAINLIGTLTPGEVTVASSKNYTFSGSGKLSGGMALNKSGSGTLTLNNANDFTGPIQISGGVLKPMTSAALGTGDSIHIQSAGTLDLNGLNLGSKSVTAEGAIVNNNTTAQLNALRFVTLSGDATFGGAGRWDIRANPTASLAGNGFNLTKNGVNEIWLVDLGETGLGDIAIRQGLLGIQLGTTLGISSNSLTLSPGTSLSFYDTGANQLNKSLSMTNATLRNDSGANTFAGPILLTSLNQFNISSALTLTGPISGFGTLAKSGTGTLLLAGTNTFSGLLYVDSASTSGSDGVVKLASGGALSGASAIILRNNNGGSSTLQLDGSAGSISLSQPITLSARNNSSVAIQHLAGTNTLTGNLNLQTGGSNYVFQSDAGLLTLTGTLPISTPGGKRTLTFQGGGDTLISGFMQNGAGGGTVGLIKSGSGKLTLTGPLNNYTGVNTINAGTLQLGDGGIGGRAGLSPIVNNGTLQMNRSDDFIWNIDVSGANGRFIKLNTNTISLIATNRYLNGNTGSAQINGGVLEINPTGRLIAANEFWIAQGATTGACVINGGVLISTNWIAVGRNNNQAVGTLTLNSGSIQKYGSGNIIVGSLGGVGTLTVNGGTISNNSQLLLAESNGGEGYFNLNGGVVQATALARFGGTIAVARFNGGTLQAVGNSPAFVVNLTQAWVQSGGLILDDGGFGLTNSQSLLQDASSPGGGFTKQGSGLVSLNSVNTFHGETRIVGGVLRLGSANALLNSTLNLAPGDNGTVSFGTLSSATIGGLAGTRDLILENEPGSAVALNFGGNGSDTVFAGKISGAGSITKFGAGKFTLSGLNDFSGNTTVNGGVLEIEGSSGFGNVAINAGTLSGNGIVNGPATIQAAATLSPGNSIGTLTFASSATLSGTTVMEISNDGATNDVLKVAGVLNCGGQLIVTNSGSALAGGDAFKLFDAATLNGAFASMILPPLESHLRWNTNDLYSSGMLTVIDVTPQLETSLADGELVLQFQSEFGLTYVLESATNLIAPVLWSPRLTNEGSGAVLTLPIPINPGEPQSFFRLKVD